MSALGSEDPESLDPTDIPQNDVDESTKDEPPAEPEPAKMSKKAMKKAAKAEHYQAIKLERRAREKQMRKEKKKIKAQKRAAGELEDDDAAEQEERERKRQKMSGFGGKVVLDLAFDEMMSEKEINSLCSQLAYTYSANRNASYPFSLLYTSLNGRTRGRLETMNNAAYSRWTKTEWWPDSYERLWSSDTDVKKSIVYLTADSTEELEELLPDEVYIIGAIVDRNRYKNLTFEKAEAQSIRHARLPIGKYLNSLPSRKVLTVNQVFEIMLKWVETRNWEEAFHSIIPKRKFVQGGKKSKGSKGISDEQEGEQEDAESGAEEELIGQQEQTEEALKY